MAPPKDFAYLLKPEIYHPLNTQTIPAPFRTSPRQPSPETPIPDLLAQGHFRAAAVAAVHALTGTGVAGSAPDPADHARIFDLLYTRLSCLTMMDATQIAAQEARALEDVNNGAAYVDEVSGAHLVPWDLRVLVVRLQALGFGDPRRAVMSYYDLAREARARVAEARAAHDHSASEAWKDRLADLGVRVAGALVEMDDPVGAAQHLATLRGRGDGKLEMMKALLWLHLGDVGAARRCVKQGGEVADRVVSALCDMADGSYEAALSAWRELKDELDGDEMVAVNLAVCHLYTGKMDQVRLISSTRLRAQADIDKGKGNFGGIGSQGLLVAHAPIQSDDHVRALHGQVQESEGETGREGGRDGADAAGLGKDQCRFQVVRKKVEIEETVCRRRGHQSLQEKNYYTCPGSIVWTQDTATHRAMLNHALVGIRKKKVYKKANPQSARPITIPFRNATSSALFL